MAKLVHVWIFGSSDGADDLVQKDKLFSVRASTPIARALAKEFALPLAVLALDSSAAIRIKPNRPCVTAASSRANAVPAERPFYPRKRTFAAQ